MRNCERGERTFTNGSIEMADVENKIKKASEWIRSAEKVVVLTGAGVSAESGIPTFRGADGLWKKFKATDLATPEAFNRNPKLVWEFYNWRRELISKVKPNRAHYAIADLEKIKPNFILITQNVDGLHMQAGSKRVLEIHGSIWRVRCTRCEYQAEDRRVPLPKLPLCPSCNSLLRPGVVWFGEALDFEVLEKAFTVSRSCDLMLVIGTSAVVYPAASLSLEAKRSGARVIEINIEETDQTSLLDLSILGKAGEVLPEILKLAESQH